MSAGVSDGASITVADRRRSTHRRRWRQTIEAYLFILPWLLGFFGLTVGPMIFSLGISLYRWNILSAPQFAGFANYGQLIHDRLFWIGLGNTSFYVFLGVPISLLVALTAAVALDFPGRLAQVFRTIFYLPSVMPVVAASIVWLWVFNPDFGLANVYLSYLGLPQQKWFYDATLAKPLFIYIGLWGIGNQMIIFLAGLQNVPTSLHEAAMIDGTGLLTRFRRVTLPMLTPVIFFNLIIGMIAAFQIFTSAFIITSGGPDNATLFYALYLYQNAFQYLKMGYASALAWILFLIALLFTLVQFIASKRWVYYESNPR